ncbi:MAG: hypothetical protein H6744_18310 [Deltaproteobacteria bacterium]|nr:hypothetical protein [Deltaproteobacteria bacterium]MCB9788634.1 hypothetical protein [Deltaproteobacteria bacterium]
MTVRSTPWTAASLTLALLACAVVLVACAGPGRKHKHPKGRSEPQYISLDGRRTRVLWNDGDSFRVLEGPERDMKARLAGYNTLESYGPVHFWGAFHGYQLYDEAKGGQHLARSREWECRTLPGTGGYKRALIQCPELTKEIIAEGLAHVFHVGDGDPDPELMRLQLQAQRERKGIWAKGIPEWVVTSIHSYGEGGDKRKGYNRVCSTRTGKSAVIEHTAVFETCDAFCWGGSCMIYAPFDVRYGSQAKPDCLHNRPPNKMTAPPHLGFPMRRDDDRPAAQAPDGPHPAPAHVVMPVVPDPPEQFITLDGVRTRVHWSDGDSFDVLEGPDKDAGVRMAEYNSLESYGPAHFWGGFDADELYANAKEATAVARTGEWHCKKLPGSGGYGRLLVACRDLAERLLRDGLGHVFHVGKGEPDPALLAIQADAQERRVGMWSKGIPQRIVTAVHSRGEKQGEPDSNGYNRVCDTRTGKSWVREHDTTFQACDAWCDGGSCMIYVPFAQRYGDEKAWCMHMDQGNRLVSPPSRPAPLGADAPLTP